jgi:hypothetical protein
MLKVISMNLGFFERRQSIMNKKSLLAFILVFNLPFLSLYHATTNAEWTLLETPVSNDLWGVWGSSENDVYAVGSLGINLHYNGNAQGDWEILQDISP